MPRESIAMTYEAVLAVLKEERWAALGTVDQVAGVWPDIVPMTLEGERVYFRVAVGSRSQANIERDDRVCCAVDRYPTYYEIKGITAHGHAKPVGDDAAERVSQALDGAGYPIGAAMDTVDAAADKNGLIYSIGLDDLTSFDFTKIVKKF